jgi:predicted adenine nucleotide alpha hydrolase (AANH) superfamily ATPase
MGRQERHIPIKHLVGLMFGLVELTEDETDHLRWCKACFDRMLEETAKHLRKQDSDKRAA